MYNQCLEESEPEVSQKEVTLIKFWRNQFAYVFVSNHANDNENMTSYTIKLLIIKFIMKEIFFFLWIIINRW